MAKIRKYDPKAVELTESPRKEGEAREWANRLYTSDAEDQFHGVWQAAPGVHANFPGQETVVVIEGRATVTGESGDSVDVGPGDLVLIDPGEVATWTVHEQLKKVFVINK